MPSPVQWLNEISWYVNGMGIVVVLCKSSRVAGQIPNV